MRPPAMAAVAAAVLLAAYPAAAATCHGVVKGSRNDEVQVSLEVGDDGAVSDAYVQWRPPSASAAPFPFLTLTYPLDGERLGALESVTVAAVVEHGDSAPKSRKAEIRLALASRSWARPWRMFEGYAAEARAGAEPGKPDKAVAFYGVVPLAWVGEGEDEPGNLDLIAAAGRGGTATIAVVGDRAERFGERTYDLSDTAARDALLAAALVEAREAAKTPQRCEAKPQ